MYNTLYRTEIENQDHRKFLDTFMGPNSIASAMMGVLRNYCYTLAVRVSLDLFLPSTRYPTIKFFQNFSFAGLKSASFAEGFLNNRFFRQLFETALDFFAWGTFWIMTKYKNKYFDPPPPTTPAPTTEAATTTESNVTETTSAYSSTSYTIYTRTTTPIYLEPEPEALKFIQNEPSSSTFGYNEGYREEPTTTTTKTTTTEKYFYVYPETVPTSTTEATSYAYKGPKRSTPKYLDEFDESELFKPKLSTSSTTTTATTTVTKETYGVLTSAEEMLFNPQTIKTLELDNVDSQMKNNSSKLPKQKEIQKLKEEEEDVSNEHQTEIMEDVSTMSSTRKPSKYVSSVKLRRTTKNPTSASTSTSTTTSTTTTTAAYIDVLDDPINVSSLSDPGTISALISTIERLGQLLQLQNNPEPSNVPSFDSYSDLDRPSSFERIDDSSNEYHHRLTQPLSKFAKPLDYVSDKTSDLVKRRSTVLTKKSKRRQKSFLRFEDPFSLIAALQHGL